MCDYFKNHSEYRLTVFQIVIIITVVSKMHCYSPISRYIDMGYKHLISKKSPILPFEYQISSFY